MNFFKSRIKHAAFSPPLSSLGTLSLRLVRRNHIVVPATEQLVDYYQIFKDQDSTLDPALVLVRQDWIACLEFVALCRLDVLNRNGGGERDRTDDPLLAKQVLSQLSYTPFIGMSPLLMPR